MSRTLCIATIAIASTFSIAGCGGGATGGQPVFPVTGSVTMFGAPLADATVAFAPSDGQPTAIGKTGSDGTFQLTTYTFGDGAAAGHFKVVVSKLAAAPAAPIAPEGADHDVPTDDHSTASAKPGSAALVPQQYMDPNQTPFTAEVSASGENFFVFEVK